jgi:hypothetical protein
VLAYFSWIKTPYHHCFLTCLLLGTIGGYGISSNSLTLPNASDHISLATILSSISSSSRRNFVAIETPCNIFERELIEGDGENSVATIAEVIKICFF